MFSSTMLIPTQTKVEKTNKNIFFDADTEKKKYIAKMLHVYSYFKENPNSANSHIKWFTNKPLNTNKPKRYKTKEGMYEGLKDSVSELTGNYNFALGMLADDGMYEVWDRPNQPCQGGEMRKYGCTHDDCTRPNDSRPGDLYYPFPDGKPLAISTKVNVNNSFDIYASKHSPYLRAFGFSKNIEKVGSKGILVKDADYIDPTMFVYMVKQMRYGEFNSSDTKLLDIIKASTLYLLRELKALPSNFSPYCYGSINKKKTAINGGIEASNDLTGGSLGNRYDYNRPDLMSVFHVKDSPSFNLTEVAKSFKLEHRKAADFNVWAKDFEDVLQGEL